MLRKYSVGIGRFIRSATERMITVKDMTTAKSKRDLTTGPIFSQMLTYALPLILTGVLQLLYNAADTVVVGQFSAEADSSLAAVGSTGSLTTLILNLVWGLSAGAMVTVAQAFGAKDSEALERSIHTSMTVAVICGIVFGIIGFIGAEQFLIWMDSPPNVIGKATLYMRIIFIGVPANVVYNFGAVILRATGDTKRPLMILSLTGIINVLLNLVLVIFFHMDVAGVAIATIVAQYLSAVAVIWLLMRGDEGVKFSFNKMGIDKDIMIRIVRVGLPSGIQGSMFSISNVLIQSAVNSLSTAVIAGNTVASNLTSFTYTAMNCFYSATLAFTGQSYGAGKHDRVNRVLLIGVLQVTLVGLIVGFGELLVADPLVRIYTDDPLIIAAAKYKMLILLSTYFTCGIMEVLVGSLRGIGCSFVPMLSSIFGACILRSWWTVVIFGIYGTEFSLYISYPISWVVTIILHLITLIVVKKRQKRKMESGMATV